MPPVAHPTVYFDYNATTPLDPEVRDVMVQALDGAWGNPSSVHHVGRCARAQLDDARDRLALLLRCKPFELIFTSGGTEANNLAVLGTARSRASSGRHLVCSSIEHHAVLSCFEYLARHEGFTLSRIPVDASGRVAPDDVAAVLRPDTILVSVMAANNETGAIQPVAEIGRICHDRGILFHTDAVQWFGKEPFSSVEEFHADLVTLCGHKFHGPRGAGALYVRSPLHIEPVMLGGAHEHERRAGTENLAAILGFVHAACRFVPLPVFPSPVLIPWKSRLLSALAPLNGVQLHSSLHLSLTNTVSFTVRGTDSISVLANLDLAGICASSGSACASGSVEPSHVLLAMGVSLPEAASFIRLSLGRENTPDEINYACSILPEALSRSQLS